MAETKLTVTADVDGLVHQIDKAAESIEFFAKSGQNSINDIADAYDDLSEKQKRSFDASKTQFDRKLDQLKELEKEYEALRQKVKSGMDLTDEEAKRVKDINREYKNLKGSLMQTSRELRLLSGYFGKSASAANNLRSKIPQTTHNLSALDAVASSLGLSLKGIGITAVAGALTSFGQDMQQQIAILSAMTGSVDYATDAYRTLNEAYRNTKFDETNVMRWSKIMINMGYNAKEASKLIQIVSDATAALGGDDSKAERIVDVLNKIRQNAILTNEDLKRLQESGITGVQEALAKGMGTDVKTLYDKIRKGGIDGRQAFDILIDYMAKKYEGATNKAKDNVRDAVGDLTGNLKEIMRELGESLVRNLGLKKLIQSLAEFSDKFLKAIQRIKSGASGVSEAMDQMTGIDGSFDAATSSLSALIAGFVTFKQLRGLDKISKSVDNVGTSLVAVKDIVDNVGSSITDVKTLALGMAKGKQGALLSSALDASDKRAKDKLKAYLKNVKAYRNAQTALDAASSDAERSHWAQAVGQLEQLVGDDRQKLRDEMITRKSIKEEMGKIDSNLGISAAKTAESTAKTTTETVKAAAATDNLAKATTNLSNARYGMLVSDSMERSRLVELSNLIGTNGQKYKEAAQSASAAAKTQQVSMSAVGDALGVVGTAYGNMGAKSNEAAKGVKRLYENQNGWVRNAGSTRNVANDIAEATKRAGKGMADYAKKVKNTNGVMAKMKGITLDGAAAIANVGSAAISAGSSLKNVAANGLKNFGAAVVSCVTNPVIAATLAITALVAAAVYGINKAMNQAKKKKYCTMLEERIDTEGVDRNDPVIQDMLQKAKRQEEMDEAIDAANKEAAAMMEDYGKTIDARIDAARKAAEMAQLGTTPGTTTDTSPKSMSQDDYTAKMAAATQEAARYRLEQENKLAEARKAAEIAYAEKVVSLLEQLGAKDAAYNKRKILNGLKADEEILKNTNAFAQTKLAAEQELANKRLELSKSTDAKAREILEKEIALADQKIKDLIANHKNDVIEIKIKAALNQMDEDLNKKIEDLGKDRTYKEDGRAGDILRSGEAVYNTAQSNTLSNYSNQAQTLATANANGDANTIMSIGQMLGLGAEEIQARGQAVADMYNVVSQALVTATAAEVDSNNQALTATNEHANAVRKLHDYVEDYKVSVGKDVGAMFSAWITGAKSASEALKDFASGLISNAVQIMAQWLGVYAILLACGSNPHLASKGASKAVLGIDGKKDGGLIVGPGSGRSDSIPTMLSNGEYVINARAVDAIGLSNLDAINRGYIPHFADGGLVGDNNNAAPVSHNNSVSLQVNAIDSSSFEDFLRRGGLDKIKQAIYSDNRNFASNVGVF